MAEPTPYEREHDFTGSDKGVLLNEELANIEAALSGVYGLTGDGSQRC